MITFEFWITISELLHSMFHVQNFQHTYTANVYSQMAVEVHWKTCFLSESTVLWLQFFYKYFTVLVVNTGKLTQIVQGKAVHFTFKNTLFLLRRNHPIGNYNWQNWQLYDCNLMAGWEIGRVRNLQQRFFEKTTSKCNKTTGFTCNFSCKRYVCSNAIAK